MKRTLSLILILTMLLSLAACGSKDAAPTDGLELFVFGNEGGWNARLVARLDNLGKGASGAAVQNLNLLCGLPETTGLTPPLPDF